MFNAIFPTMRNATGAVAQPSGDQNSVVVLDDGDTITLSAVGPNSSTAYSYQVIFCPVFPDGTLLTSGAVTLTVTNTSPEQAYTGTTGMKQWAVYSGTITGTVTTTGATNGRTGITAGISA